MPVSLRNEETRGRRRDQLVVSSSASAVPWKAAGLSGAVVSGGDLLLHVIAGHLALSSSLSAGTVAFFTVAAGGMLLRQRPGRAAAWARQNPWSFAVLPAAATSMIVFVLAYIIGSSGLLGGAFTALWHGAIAYALTGIIGAVASRQRRPA